MTTRGVAAVTSLYWFSAGKTTSPTEAVRLPRLGSLESIKRFIVAPLTPPELKERGNHTVCLLETHVPLTYLEAARLMQPALGHSHVFSMVRCLGGLYVTETFASMWQKAKTAGPTAIFDADKLVLPSGVLPLAQVPRDGLLTAVGTIVPATSLEDEPVIQSAKALQRQQTTGMKRDRELNS
jgi:hypothetical protein